MCGIVGSIALTGSDSVNVDRVRAARGVLAHRGPDDAGLAIGNWGEMIREEGSGPRNAPVAIALGHRRLSIIDVTAGGHQPMQSADGTASIVFNGEIYNYIELRALLSRDVDFQTQSDTEVLLAGLRLRGERFLCDVTGMFAFVFVDAQKEEVLLGRDHFGIKPLYYTVERGTLHFASELKGLRAVAADPWDISARATLQFLRFGVTDDTQGTFFTQVDSVAAAHTVSFTRKRPVAIPTRFWQLTRDIHTLRPEEAPSLVARTLAASVALHLRSDVPVGACLSGGLDSTALVANMRTQLGQSADIHAFSFISPVEEQSESAFVDAAVREYRLVEHKTSGSADSLAEVIADVIQCQDEPFGTLSIVAQHAVFRCAHECGVKVLLDGQGADELFGGYVPALSSRVAELLRAGRLREVGRLLQTFDFVSPASGRARMLLGAIVRLLPPWAVARALSMAGEPVVPRWLRTAWLAGRMEDTSSLAYAAVGDLRDELIAFVEARTLPALLRFEDRNSMRWSVESRVPFCTPKLAELAMSLPSRLLVDERGRTKAVLRDALIGLVPISILERPKIGFLAPDRQWSDALSGWIDDALRDGEERLAKVIAWGNVALAGPVREGQSGRDLLQRWRIASYCAWARHWNVQAEVANRT